MCDLCICSEGPKLRYRLCCRHLEIPNDFEQNILHFPFALFSVNDVAALFTGGFFCLFFFFLLVPLIFRTLRVGGPRGSAFKGLSSLLKPTPFVISSGLMALVTISALMSPQGIFAFEMQSCPFGCFLGCPLG